jgi:hypothetical protein
MKDLHVWKYEITDRNLMENFDTEFEENMSTG